MAGDKHPVGHPSLATYRAAPVCLTNSQHEHGLYLPYSIRLWSHHSLAFASDAMA